MTYPVKLRLRRDTFEADLVRDGGQFETDNGIETAVLCSLFTDGRAGDDDELPGKDGDRRGYWADAYNTEAQRSKSRLWLISRSKATADVVAAAKTYCEEALAWMIADGAASEIVVTSEKVGLYILGLRIQIYRPGDESPAYDQLWELLLDAV